MVYKRLILLCSQLLSMSGCISYFITSLLLKIQLYKTSGVTEKRTLRFHRAIREQDIHWVPSGRFLIDSQLINLVFPRVCPAPGWFISLPSSPPHPSEIPLSDASSSAVYTTLCTTPYKQTGDSIFLEKTSWESDVISLQMRVEPHKEPGSLLCWKKEVTIDCHPRGTQST